MPIIMNGKLDEHEIWKLAEHAYAQYQNVMRENEKPTKDFEDLSDSERDAWMESTDRICELLFYSYNIN